MTVTDILLFLGKLILGRGRPWANAHPSVGSAGQFGLGGSDFDYDKQGACA